MIQAGAEATKARNCEGIAELRRQAQELKAVVAEQALELRDMKKSMIAGLGETRNEIPGLREIGDHPPG
jgi:hypothetical protein